MRSHVARAKHYGSLAARAATAEVEATARGVPGHRFGRYGRALGARLIRSGARRRGASLVLTPVNSVRYWEFDFVERHLPIGGRAALDVSSPRLLSLYLAERRRFERITIANPDSSDLAATLDIINTLRLPGIEVVEADAVQATSHVGSVDATWSISVVEHIAGDDGDSGAVGAMYAALAPGGTMVITVPVDRTAWDEYRDHDAYGLAPEESDQYFFQRYYDDAAVRRRLIDAVGTVPSAVEWFGERARGVFAAYEKEWMARGHAATVRDPAFVSKEFRRYPSWSAMPGMGVCGMAFRKQRDD